MTLVPLVCVVLAQASAVDLSASSGVAVPYGQIAPGFAVSGVGPTVRLEALYRLTPKVALGASLETSEGEIVFTELLAQASRPIWAANLGGRVEVRPIEAGRVSPFVAAQLGWQFTSASHGPSLGVSAGVDFKPATRVPLWLGLSANETLSILSNRDWPSAVNGYALRTITPTQGDAGWGRTWVGSAWFSAGLRLRLTL